MKPTYVREKSTGVIYGVVCYDVSFVVVCDMPHTIFKRLRWSKVSPCEFE
jgi:hypothetical protein